MLCSLRAEGEKAALCEGLTHSHHKANVCCIKGHSKVLFCFFFSLKFLHQQEALLEAGCALYFRNIESLDRGYVVAKNVKSEQFIGIQMSRTEQGLL